jgi:hypothetical protein
MLFARVLSCRDLPSSLPLASVKEEFPHELRVRP